MGKKRTDNHVQSVERALSILEEVAAAGEIGVSELGQRLGLHVATVHNILRTFAATAYLENVNGRYRPGPALAVLLGRSNPMLLLARLAQPVLEAIVRATGEAASMTMLVGTSARLVAFQPGTQPITIQYPQWVWDDPLQLATGRVLVAFSPESCRRECVARHREQTGDAPCEETWEEQFAGIRAVCEAEAVKTNQDSQYAIARAIDDRDGRVIAAIGASCPAFRADAPHRQRMLDAVRDAATVLTERIRQ